MDENEVWVSEIEAGEWARRREEDGCGRMEVEWRSREKGGVETEKRGGGRWSGERVQEEKGGKEEEDELMKGILGMREKYRLMRP